MKRGRLVTIAHQGDFGKPRPALIIQSDLFGEHPSVTVLPVTSTVAEASLLRISLWPNDQNGLLKPSQIMVDKATTLRRDKVGATFGHVDTDTLVEVERCLAIFLGIAK